MGPKRLSILTRWLLVGVERKIVESVEEWGEEMD